MGNRSRTKAILTLALGFAIGALFQGNVSGQVRPAAVQSFQRVTIDQNGTVLGTIEVPVGIDFRVGTAVSHDGRVGDSVIYIGQPNNTAPVVVNLTRGATLR